jgi:hypothetical protein
MFLISLSFINAPSLVFLDLSPYPTKLPDSWICVRRPRSTSPPKKTFPLQYQVDLVTLACLGTLYEKGRLDAQSLLCKAVWCCWEHAIDLWSLPQSCCWSLVAASKGTAKWIVEPCIVWQREENKVIICGYWWASCRHTFQRPQGDQCEMSPLVIRARANTCVTWLLYFSHIGELVTWRRYNE